MTFAAGKPFSLSCRHRQSVTALIPSLARSFGPGMNSSASGFGACGKSVFSREWTEGDIDDWLPVANVIATEGDISMEDYSDYEAIEWANETDQDEIGEPESKSRPDKRDLE